VQGATLVVANKAEATVSLIDLVNGEVAATLPTSSPKSTSRQGRSCVRCTPARNPMEWVFPPAPPGAE